MIRIFKVNTVIYLFIYTPSKHEWHTEKAHKSDMHNET